VRSEIIKVTENFEMSKPSCVTIISYDEDAQQLKMFTVLQREVQSVIDLENARGGGMTFPPDAEARSTAPLTDEDARKLGGMAMLLQAAAHPELRERLQITTAAPMDWSPVARPPET
jgi:hypothetical protein